MLKTQSLAISDPLNTAPNARHTILATLDDGRTVEVFSYTGPVDLLLLADLQGLVGEPLEHVADALIGLYWRQDRCLYGPLGV